MASERKTALVFLVICGVFICGVLFYLRGKQPPGEITWDRLQELKTAIVAYSKEHGKAPDTLEALRLPQTSLEDHTGKRFFYSVAEKSVTIGSFGADGKPGGAVFNTDSELSFKLD